MRSAGEVPYSIEYLKLVLHLKYLLYHITFVIKMLSVVQSVLSELHCILPYNYWLISLCGNFFTQAQRDGTI